MTCCWHRWACTEGDASKQCCTGAQRITLSGRRHRRVVVGLCFSAALTYSTYDADHLVGVCSDGPLSVEITLKDLEIQAAESEQAKAKDQISTPHTRLLAAQEESSQRDTSKTAQVQRTRTSQRNSGSLFIPLSNKIVFFNACQ